MSKLQDKVGLLSSLDHKEFTSICSTNKEFAALCSGKLSSKFIVIYGDITEEIYKSRCHNFFSADIIEKKPSNITWKEFYNRIIKLNLLLETNHPTLLLDYYQKKNNSFVEIDILNLISNK